MFTQKEMKSVRSAARISLKKENWAILERDSKQADVVRAAVSMPQQGLKDTSNVDSGCQIDGAEYAAFVEKNPEESVYEVINKSASNNSLVQTISGVIGFPATLVADVGVLFACYGMMLNNIRIIYGRQPLDTEAIVTFVGGCKDDILVDLMIDKIIGNIPIIGIGANLIAARVMSWRLGMTMGLLSARGESIDAENAKNASILIRKAFPQENLLKFRQPSKKTFGRLLGLMRDIGTEDFNCKTLDIISRLEN